MSTITKGYYRSYDYNPLLQDSSKHYEVLCTSENTETGKVSVVYRPLWIDEHFSRESYSWTIEEFTERVVVAQIEMNRFELITDTETIEKLNRVREEMYGKQ